MEYRATVAKAAIFVAVLAGAFTLRMAWEVFDLRLPSPDSVARAQGTGGGQRLQPTQQTGDTIVFTGSGADLATTETFEISASQWTITSESDPPGNNPLITVLTENDDLIDTSERFKFNGPDTYSVTAEPGSYYLEITPLVENASYTVTVDQGGGSATASPPSTATASPPSTSSPQPQQSPPPTSRDDLFSAGGPSAGPLPLMRDGGCPKEYPVKRSSACYAHGS